ASASIVLFVSVSAVARPTKVSVATGRERVPPLFSADSFSVPLASPAAPLPTAKVDAAVRDRPASSAVPNVNDPRSVNVKRSVLTLAERFDSLTFQPVPSPKNSRPAMGEPNPPVRIGVDIDAGKPALPVVMIIPVELTWAAVMPVLVIVAPEVQVEISVLAVP